VLEMLRQKGLNMALIVDCACRECGKGWRGAVGSGLAPPTLCDECWGKENNRKRREHFGALDALTMEERIRNIEEWIYEYRPPRTEPMIF
jgi:hypothetical protein